MVRPWSVCSQVSKHVRLPVSDREFPTMTALSGTQRARDLQIRRSMEPVRPVLRNPESQVSVLPGVRSGRHSPVLSRQFVRKL